MLCGGNDLRIMGREAAPSILVERSRRAPPTWNLLPPVSWLRPALVSDIAPWCGIVQIVTGVGLFPRQRWAWVLALLSAALSLLIPLYPLFTGNLWALWGLIIPGIIFHYLLTDSDVKRALGACRLPSSVGTFAREACPAPVNKNEQELRPQFEQRDEAQDAHRTICMPPRLSPVKGDTITSLSAPMDTSTREKRCRTPYSAGLG
jgi:hypothetical protein